MRPRLAVLVAVLATVPACGHRGDPVPPRRRTPPPPHEFRVAQRGDAVVAEATAPTDSVDGVPYEQVSVEFLWAEGQRDVEKAGQHRAVPATPGARVVQSLPLPSVGTTLRVAARAVAGGRKGQRTLTVALAVRTPPEAPAELTAALAPGGVALSWHGPRPRPTPPAEASPATPGAPGASARPGVEPGTPGAQPQPPPRPAPTGTKPPTPLAPSATPGQTPPAGSTGEAAALNEGEERPGEGGAPTDSQTTGFFVYRRVGDAAYDRPLGQEPLERRALNDTLVPVGATACYVVRAVASVQPLIESAPSNEVCVAVRDVTPPATPAGLAVLPREGGIEILWSPSPEPDLAGYRVYRAGPDGEAQRVAEVPAGRASWVDESARPRVAYRYAVTAYDRAGNESGRTEPIEATLP